MRRPTSPVVPAAGTAALVVVAVVGLVLDGLEAAAYPASFAILWFAAFCWRVRYPPGTKALSTRQRIIAVLALGALPVVLSFGAIAWSLNGTSNENVPWTFFAAFVVSTLAIGADMVPAFFGLVRGAFQSPRTR